MSIEAIVKRKRKTRKGKGFIGSRTAEKLIKAGIENANQLATSSPQAVAEALGSSEKRATRLAEDARSLLNEP